MCLRVLVKCWLPSRYELLIYTTRAYSCNCSAEITAYKVWFWLSVLFEVWFANRVRLLFTTGSRLVFLVEISSLVSTFRLKNFEPF